MQGMGNDETPFGGRGGRMNTRIDWFGRNQVRRTSHDITVRDDLESVI